MTAEIDITSELLPRHVRAFDTIAQLGVRFGPNRWVIVGGLMVMILGREYEARSPRAEGTKDADILVDLVTSPGLLAEVAHFLESMGYELQEGPGDETKAARCTFVYHSAQIDVLCPDDTPEGQLVIPDRHVASIAIPGGRRAFETARPVSLLYSEERPNAEVFVPTLAGAIAVKTAAAVDPRTAESPRHAQDVAFMLTIPADPELTRSGLVEADIRLLRQLLPQIKDARSAVWQQLDAPQRQVAQATYEFLVA